MNVLITGGAGYLGSILTLQMLSDGHKVTVLDSFIHGSTGLAFAMTEKNLTVIRGDVRDSRLMEELIPKYDVLIPLAAIVGLPACQRAYIQDVININSTTVKSLCKYASHDQIILYPNTNSGYGTVHEGNCTEEQPLLPISLYGQTKAEAEVPVLEHPNGVSFRFATLFGFSPRMRIDLMVNEFVYRAVKDRALVLFEPHYRRNFLHVWDAANAFSFTLNHIDQMRGQVFNCGLSSANISKLQLCKMIQQEVPDFIYYEAEYASDPDKRNYVISNAKLEALGWYAGFSLESGIKELAKGFRSLPFDGSYRNA